MNVPAIAFSIFVALMITLPGCSEEEQPPYPDQKSIVKKTIKRPEPRKTEVLPPVPESKPETAAKEAAKTEMIPPETVEPKDENEIKKEEEKGYYVTKKGDSLSKIALRSDMYGDPLKWPFIYRLNKEILDEIGSNENAPHRFLKEGTRLKVIKPDEAMKILETRPKNYWVINVLSSSKMEEIVPNAIKLIKHGYPAYLTRTRVDGKNWTRIRIGFFGKKEDADLEGKKVMEFMNLSEIWITKIGRNEFEEFGGYE